MLSLGAPLGGSRSEPLFDLSRISASEDRPEPKISDGGAAPGLEAQRPVASSLPTRPFGPLASLVMHLLPLLLLIDWPMLRRPPVEITPIPVQLVMLPPSAPALEKAPVKPPPGRLASEDIGDTKTERQPADKERPNPQSAPPAPVSAPKPAPQRTAAVIPPPATVKAAAPTEASFPEPPRPKPKPTPAPRQPAHRAVPTRPVHHARYPGPAATRSQYLAYLAALTREHIDLLPPQVIGGRHGETVIALVLHDDGRIGSMRIERSSGYPDIDHRIEGMIRAVGKFPPVPQWFQGTSLPLQFRMRFPWTLEP